MSTKKGSFLDELDSADEIEVRADKAEKYQAPDKGKKNRIGFPLLKKDGKLAVQTVEFFKGEIDGKYVSFQAPKNKELYAACEKKFGKSLTRYVTIVIKYPIKKDGKISGGGDYELFALVMDNKKFQAIQGISTSWGFNRVDVEVTSTNPEYQDMTFMPSEPANWCTNKSFEKETIIEEALELAELMLRTVTNVWSEERLTEVLGLDEDDEDEEADSSLDDEDEDEEDEDETPAPSKKKPKPAVIDEDEDDEEEEDLPKKKPAKGSDYDKFVSAPSKKKPAVIDDEDEDEEDEPVKPSKKKPVIDDEDDEEDEQPKKKAKRPVLEDDEDDE